MVRLATPGRAVHHRAMKTHHGSRRLVGRPGRDGPPVLDRLVHRQRRRRACVLSKFADGLDSTRLRHEREGRHGPTFVVEQTGRIRVIKNGVLLPTPFLDISSQVSTGGEQGLLGLAFHPSYKTNGMFYVDFTRANGRYRRSTEYRVSSTDPDVAAALERRADHDHRPAVRQPQRRDDHLRPGRLPVHRDGRRRGAAATRAIAPRTWTRLLGKMLRINVNGSAGTRQYRIPSSQPVRRQARPSTRSGRTACATRGGSRSTG